MRKMRYNRAHALAVQQSRTDELIQLQAALKIGESGRCTGVVTIEIAPLTDGWLDDEISSLGVA